MSLSSAALRGGLAVPAKSGTRRRRSDDGSAPRVSWTAEAWEDEEDDGVDEEEGRVPAARERRREAWERAERPDEMRAAMWEWSFAREEVEARTMVGLMERGSEKEAAGPETEERVREAPAKRAVRVWARAKDEVSASAGKKRSDGRARWVIGRAWRREAIAATKLPCVKEMILAGPKGWSCQRVTIRALSVEKLASSERRGGAVGASWITSCQTDTSTEPPRPLGTSVQSMWRLDFSTTQTTWPRDGRASERNSRGSEPAEAMRASALVDLRKSTTRGWGWLNGRRMTVRP
jgi:hypothetical protein